MDGVTADGRKGHWRLYMLVSISGAAVLAVELLGTRLLGPFYGVSLFLWSALISVTLAALSTGYAVGGRLADRKASFTRLGAVIGIAGIWLLLVPWLRGFVLRALQVFDDRARFVDAAPPQNVARLRIRGRIADRRA